MTSVNTNVSDLFFNRDLDDAKVYDGPKKSFSHWDEECLATEASMMLESLSDLGVDNLPTSAEVVTDFMNRV